MGKSRPPPKPAAAAAPFHNPFGGLSEKLGIAPAPPSAAASGEDAAPPAAPATPGHPSPDATVPRGAAAQRGPPRAVVRIERKGRGGKEATIVEKLDLPVRELEAWLGDLKRGLGCGGHLEGAALVLHGDLRSRVKGWLEQRGVRKVTLG